jgi:hypothetical protein
MVIRLLSDGEDERSIRRHGLGALRGCAWRVPSTWGEIPEKSPISGTNDHRGDEEDLDQSPDLEALPRRRSIHISVR